MADLSQTADKSKGYVFVSFSPSDRKRVKNILLELESKGINLLYQKKEYGAAEYRRVVAKKIRSADAVIVLLTKPSKDTSQVDNEVHIAAESGKKIIPVYLGTSYDDQPNSFKWCLYDKPSVDGGRRAKKVAADILSRLPESTAEAAADGDVEEKIERVAVRAERKEKKEKKRSNTSIMLFLVTVSLSVIAVVLALWRAGYITFEFLADDTAVPTTLSTGDILLFGSYEQDGDASNGDEPIEWKVVDVSDGKALVVAVNSLCYKPYNDRNVKITWQDCSLRNWLNDEFYRTAFTERERTKIVLTKNDNNRNSRTNVKGGEKTNDYLFCFSLEEIERYFPTASDRYCMPSMSTMLGMYGKKTASIGDMWWTRSPGMSEGHAAYIKVLGNIDYYGLQVHIDNIGVRPAMWVYMG